MPVWTYILKSIKNGSYYVGISSRLRKRLNEHNTGQSKSTSLLRPWEIIYKEKHEDYQSAREREKYLKSGAGRKWIRETFGEKH
jgi:putative endonuclease